MCPDLWLTLCLSMAAGAFLGHIVPGCFFIVSACSHTAIAQQAAGTEGSRRHVPKHCLIPNTMLMQACINVNPVLTQAIRSFVPPPPSLHLLLILLQLPCLVLMVLPSMVLLQFWGTWWAIAGFEYYLRSLSSQKPFINGSWYRWVGAQARPA